MICAALTAVALAQDTIYRQPPRAHSPSHYQKPYEAGPPPKYPQQQYQKPEANPEEYPAAYPAEPKQPEAPKYHQEPKYPEKPKYPEPPKYQPRPAYPAVPVYPAKPHPPVYKPGPKPSAESYDYAIDVSTTFKTFLEMNGISNFNYSNKLISRSLKNLTVSVMT